jgi:hypothetical protein
MRPKIMALAGVCSGLLTLLVVLLLGIQRPELKTGVLALLAVLLYPTGTILFYRLLLRDR